MTLIENPYVVLYLWSLVIVDLKKRRIDTVKHRLAKLQFKQGDADYHAAWSRGIRVAEKPICFRSHFHGYFLDF